jgi:hypothetical protein
MSASTSPSPIANPKSPPCWLYGVAVGAICCGAAGAAYACFLHFNPEYKDALIREQLSKPHPDNPRYVASILAIRYQGLAELVVRRALGLFVFGGLLGGALGFAFAEFRRRKQPAASEAGRAWRFKLIDVLVVISILGVLIAIFQPGQGAGLVYYQGKDQFYWLQRLQFESSSERRQAVTALCSLLERRPFPCRSTIIPALAECGPDAAPAIPILQKLTLDGEETVSTAAADALLKLTSGARSRRRMTFLSMDGVD